MPLLSLKFYKIELQPSFPKLLPLRFKSLSVLLNRSKFPRENAASFSREQEDKSNLVKL